jgi:hypothetical protein
LTLFSPLQHPFGASHLAILSLSFSATVRWHGIILQPACFVLPTKLLPQPWILKHSHFAEFYTYSSLSSKIQDNKLNFNFRYVASNILV